MGRRSFLSKVSWITAVFFFAASAVAATAPLQSGSPAEQMEAGKRYFSDGRFEDALAAWDVALARYRQADDKAGQARVLQHKGEAYLAIGH